MKNYQMYINGQWTSGSTGKTFYSANPYTGENWAEIPHGSPADVDAAVKAAKAALSGPWSELSPSRRGRMLYEFGSLIDKHADHLARIEVRDNGKLFAEMSKQTAYLAEWFRYYGGLADKIEGTVIPIDRPNMFNYTRREPLGVVGLITPWNSPLLLLGFKLAPALAAGNTAVIKPSEFTSASTLELMALFEEAKFPAGVVNTVTGFGADVGATLVEHPDVAKIAFTGSDITGQKIYEAGARDLKRVSLELGGKSPNIVFEDADLDAAVVGAISGIFAASGQTCIAGSRLLLQKSIHDEFVNRLVEMAREARIGDPMLAETHVGPVTTKPQFDKVLHYIEAAKREGAKCVLGGGAYSPPNVQHSQFIAPTIFTNVDNRMTIAQEEVFGPVLAIIPFDDEEDAISKANDIIYGLAAGVWTTDMGRAFRMSERLQAGTVWINTYRAASYLSPFGGYKRSGVGHENGIRAMDEYLQTKSVWISTSSDVAHPFVMR